MPKTAAVLGGLVLLASLATGASAADRVRPVGENPLKTDTRSHAASPTGGVRYQAVQMDFGLGDSLVATTASQKVANLGQRAILFKPLTAGEELDRAGALSLAEAVQAKLRSASEAIQSGSQPLRNNLKLRVIDRDGESMNVERTVPDETTLSGGANGGTISQ